MIDNSCFSTCKEMFAYAWLLSVGRGMLLQMRPSRGFGRAGKQEKKKHRLAVGYTIHDILGILFI